MKNRIAFVTPLVALLACTACSSASGDAGNEGSMQVALTNVPSDVSCIRLTLTGSGATVQRSFDLAHGASSVLLVDSLPPGNMTFGADAFGGACASVTPATVGAWVSKPQTVNLVAGVPSFVTLTMQRNGEACVSVDFPVDGFSGDAGVVATPTGPTATIASGPSGTVNTNTASFAFTATTTDAIFQCSLDGAAFAVCGSPFTPPPLADGAHTFSVRAVSPTCVFGPVASRTWTIDTLAPTTIITGGPAAGAIVASTTATFAFTTTGAATTQCVLDAGVPYNCTSPATVTGLTQGNHLFQVRATDAAGNTSVMGRNWTVDTIPPTVVLSTTPPATTNATTATFAFTSTEAGVTFQCTLDTNAPVTCVSPMSYSSLMLGTHTFAVRALDAAGNSSSPVTATWTITP